MLASLIVGAGCFWGVEALYEDMPGVLNATSGYAGGSLENPRYEDVLTGETGHVEVVKIDYDTSEVTFDTLIDAFFIMHDPTTLNRQGPDIGEQYLTANVGDCGLSTVGITYLLLAISRQFSLL